MIVNNGPPAPGYIDQQGDFHYYDPDAGPLGAMADDNKKKLALGAVFVMFAATAAGLMWMWTKEQDDAFARQRYWRSFRGGRKRRRGRRR